MGSRSRCYRRTRAAECAAVLNRRRERSLTAAVDADLTAVIENVGAGRDVDQADRSQPVFGRQRADDQGDAADPAGVENAAEAGEAVGQHHAIDAKLHVGVVVADVQQSAGGGILRDARRLQQDSLDRGIVATGQCVDRGLSDDARSRADGGEEVAARLIEGFGFGIELRPRRDRLRSGRRCGRLSGR